MDATEIRIFQDGDQWCAVLGDFENLQKSLAGFQYTPKQAIDELCLELLRSCSCPDRSGSCEACKAFYEITTPTRAGRC